MKSDVSIFENRPRKFSFHYNRTKIMGTLHEDLYTFLITRRLILLRIRNVSGNSFRGNQNTHFVFINVFFENHAFYEIMWGSIVEPDRLQMTIWRTRVACWIPKATNTHSQCVILIVFLLNSGCSQSPQRYVIRTLPVLFLFVCDHYLSYLFVLLLINVFL